jgi:PAS domain S-box-containing protein
MPKMVIKSDEQIGAEAEVEGFRRNLGPFVVAADSTRIAMVFTDAKAEGDPIIFANDSFLALTGYTRVEVLGQTLDFLVAVDSRPRCLIQEALAHERRSHSAARYQRKDGTNFWAEIFVNPVHDRAGAIVEHFASFVDLTSHKREEERLRFLLDELNHRTQNTLATVQAIAMQTLRAATDRAVLNTFEGRILALSKAHSLLGRENWHAVSLGDVLGLILQPFGLDGVGLSRFSISGVVVRLQPKAALSLAMVFHELATNAAKYGALSANATGKIDVSWVVVTSPEGQRLRLRWRESGGPPVAAPGPKGFGSRLIEDGLAQELDGKVTLEYAPEGLTCEIAMPLPPTGDE